MTYAADDCGISLIAKRKVLLGPAGKGAHKADAPTYRTVKNFPDVLEKKRLPAAWDAFAMPHPGVPFPVQTQSS